MKNSINIFRNTNEMGQHEQKRTANCSNTLIEAHHPISIMEYKGCRERRAGHGFRKFARNDFNDAFTMRKENLERYIKLYNERHPERMSWSDLRQVSLWQDRSHERMYGYHGVDTDTKYCPLHLKDEKPYLYEGIELEVTWDDEAVDSYRGDRYDEYGEYDECGDYDDEGNYIPDYYEFDIGEVVKEALKIGKGLFTAEQDGSLYYGYSAEFVSRPLSVRAWHSPEVVAILKEFTDYLKSTGALVDQPSGNGFHIHVSKKFFEANPACNRNLNEVAQDMNWIFQKYQDEIEAIGGRAYNEWCASAKMGIKRDLASEYGIVIDKAHISKSALEIPYDNHRKAFINSASGYTYEARVFHSTLDVERILACIEFMRNISHGARENALEGKTFGQITRYKDAPNLQALIRRIKAQRKLYLGKKNTNALVLA